ncbi:MAG: hypothetical protein QW210_00280 [Candidatus Woesearchaeota archaeon]
MILNGFILLFGFILLRFSIIGIIIILFSIFSLIFSYYELKKFPYYEKIKKSYSVESIADFTNTLYELSYKKKEK